ncbi:MAG: RNA recognition motif domain-containing protein [Bacteroidota bacterium]|jgi:RNA recognition motif-containing protein
MNLYIGNLAWGVTDQDLNELLAQYGSVTSAKVVTDKITRRSRGFGFAEMPNDQEAQNAINDLNGKPLKGRNITINEARPRTNREG